MKRRLFVAGIGFTVAGLTLLAPSAGGQGADRPPVVTAAVQITNTPSPVRAHNSPLIARNPKNGELVVAEVDSRGSRACQVHISTDSGRSWFAGGDMMTKPFTDCSIGAEWGTYFNVFFAPDGTLFIPFAANDPKLLTAPRTVTTEDDRDSIPRHVFLARSTDGGRSFTTAEVYRTAQGSPDFYNKGVVGAIDPTNPNYVYVGWRQGAFSSETSKLKNPIAASSDGGRTFGEPVDVTDAVGADHPWLAVDGRGTLHVVNWGRSFGLEDPVPLRPINHYSSTDHGKTFEHSVVDPGNDRSYRTPVLVADPNSTKLYVTWAGSATPKNVELEDADRTEIFFRASTDGGATWSDRVTVNDDAGKGRNHWLPGMALAPNGRIDIAWYDTRLSPVPAADPEGEKGTTDVFYASSTDGGATFSVNMRVSDRSADRSIGVWGNSIGTAAPVGMTSTDKGVFFTWQDTRNGNAAAQSEDIYMSSIGLDGVAPLTTDAKDDDDTPAGVLVGVGLALGAGVAMLAASAVGRK